MKVFLTGGTGMVGRNILKHANQNDYIIDAPSSLEINLLVYEELLSYLEQKKPDIVLHCAGLVGGIKANLDRPFDFCYYNMKMGFNLIHACSKVGIDKLINLGSSCMYPHAASNPLKEDMLLSSSLEPTNEGYAIAKLAVAKLAEYAGTQLGFSYKTIIPCNLYGPWDKFELETAHMLPAAISKVHKAKVEGYDYVEVWGNGHSRREFMYVEDLVEFLFLALDRFDEVPVYMNLGLGTDYSVRDYYREIKDALGYTGKFIYDTSKPTGIKNKLVDITHQKKWNWMPKTSLNQGILKTYDFYLKGI